MAGERYFDLGREDAQAPSVSRIRGRCHEDRLREVELARDLLHTLAVEPAGVGKHRQLIAAERPVGENVTSVEAVTHSLKSLFVF